MTIDELSEHSGVPKGTLNKIIGNVTKAPTLDNMKAIARALGKTLADFDDLPVNTKHPPSEDVASLGGDVLDIFNYLNDGLVSLGLINENEDVDNQQADILVSVARILRATFDKN